MWTDQAELLRVWRNNIATDASGRRFTPRTAAVACAKIDSDRAPSRQTIYNWEDPRRDASPRFESGLATLDKAYRAGGALEGLVLATPKVFAPRFIWSHNFVPLTTKAPESEVTGNETSSAVWPPTTLSVLESEVTGQDKVGGRVWAWLRPGPNGDGIVDVRVRWGVFEASVARRTGDEGLFLTCRVSTPHPAAFIAWRRTPGWCDFGTGPIPRALGVEIISEVDVMTIRELSQSLRHLFRATWRAWAAVETPTASLQKRLLVLLLKTPGVTGRRDATTPPDGLPLDPWPDPNLGSDYAALREARGMTQRYAADLVSSHLAPGQYVSSQQLSDFEEHRRRTRVPYFASMLDRAYGADGFTCRERVNEIDAAGAGRSQVHFPYHWVGPIVITLSSPRGNGHETADMDLRWGSWHSPLRVRSGLGVTCRRDAPGAGEPLVIDHPPDWELTVELGYNPEAVDINGDNWDVVPEGEERLFYQNLPIYRRLFQLAAHPNRDE